MRSIKLPMAVVQFASTPMNLSANLDRISSQVAEACSQGARMVVFPELASTGYVEDVNLHDLAEDQQGTTVQTLSSLSRNFGVHVAAGFVEWYRGDVYNSLAFCSPRGEVSIYRKRHLIFWEHFYFRHGHEPLIVRTEFGRIGFAICADMMYRNVWAQYRGQIDLAVIIAAWPRRTAQTAFRVGWMLDPSWGLAGELPVRIADDLKVSVVFSNQCGPCQVRIPSLGPATPAAFAARSGIFDPNGRRLTPESDDEGVSIGSVNIHEEPSSCVTLSA